MSFITSGDAKQAVYALIPVVSPEVQQANLVVDTRMEVSAWLNGKPVVFSSEKRDQGEPRTAVVDLPSGSSKLMMRLASDTMTNGQTLVTTTFVADQPVGFD